MGQLVQGFNLFTPTKEIELDTHKSKIAKCYQALNGLPKVYDGNLDTNFSLTKLLPNIPCFIYVKEVIELDGSVGAVEGGASSEELTALQTQINTLNSDIEAKDNRINSLTASLDSVSMVNVGSNGKVIGTDSVGAIFFEYGEDEIYTNQLKGSTFGQNYQHYPSDYDESITNTEAFIPVTQVESTQVDLRHLFNYFKDSHSKDLLGDNFNETVSVPFDSSLSVLMGKCKIYAFGDPDNRYEFKIKIPTITHLDNVDGVDPRFGSSYDAYYFTPERGLIIKDSNHDFDKSPHSNQEILITYDKTTDSVNFKVFEVQHNDSEV